jgi:hypothetical protein
MCVQTLSCLSMLGLFLFRNLPVASPLSLLVGLVALWPAPLRHTFCFGKPLAALRASSALCKVVVCRHVSMFRLASSFYRQACSQCLSARLLRLPVSSIPRAVFLKVGGATCALSCAIGSGARFRRRLGRIARCQRFLCNIFGLLLAAFVAHAIVPILLALCRRSLSGGL